MLRKDIIMAFCINCGKQIGDNYKFCLFCGAAQPIDEPADLPTPCQARAEDPQEAPAAAEACAPLPEEACQAVFVQSESEAQAPAEAYSEPDSSVAVAEAPVYVQPVQDPPVYTPCESSYRNYASVDEAKQLKKRTSKASTLGIISFASGIAGMVICGWIEGFTVCAIVSFIFGTVAALFGLLALNKSRNIKGNKIFAIIGLILGVLGLMRSFLYFILLLSFGGEQGFLDYINGLDFNFDFLE